MSLSHTFVLTLKLERLCLAKKILEVYESMEISEAYPQEWLGRSTEQSLNYCKKTYELPQQTRLSFSH